ncbi:MAG: sigma-54-dependent Fis family transcriptional regulator [Verrucomicrobiales bacterium]|nr:sigma-54-dependent Fis family transcriptional regulator [Verrucomicrobiales bacterium]
MAETETQTIVIADPDADFLAWAEKHLTAKGINVHSTSDSEKALKLFTDHEADLLVADFFLAPLDGLALLKKVRLTFPNSMVLLVGTTSSTNAVIEAMKLGAFDVLRKESVNFDLRPAAERALQAAEQTRLAASSTESEPILPPQPSGDVIIGRSPAMQDVYKLIGRVARADAPVLITGESGVGKEVVSNAIHQFSRRSNGEYVAINCAAIPSNLLESELFGHEKGAFTGATGQRIGRFEQCHNGTLFLDEIGDMPLEVQSKLLRVLQSGEFARVGGNQTLQSDVRILAATNKQLESEVKDGRFREDLFYRLNVVRIHIPPLRRRPEDIRLLAEFFLGRQAEKGKARQMQLSAEAVDLLENHSWPGNVRELENTIERACVLATGNVLLPQDLPLDSSGCAADVDSGEDPDARAAATAILRAADAPTCELSPLELAEREILRVALDLADGDDAVAAKRVGLTKAALKKRLGG